MKNDKLFDSAFVIMFLLAWIWLCLLLLGIVDEYHITAMTAMFCTMLATFARLVEVRETGSNDLLACRNLVDQTQKDFTEQLERAEKLYWENVNLKQRIDDLEKDV